MEKAKVYFTDMRTGYGGLSLPQKLAKLIKAAGIGNIDFNKKFAAIKIHFGEPGNVSYLRPNYAKAVADVVKEFGGMPFLTDCNTLYVGRRKHALEHITAAYENGFSPFSTGCHVIIADGLKGTDEAYVPVPGGEVVKEAKIGKALMDADIIISLNHFKGHEAAGFGGAIKNIGMLASFDPVALDQACADLVNAAPVMQNSILAEHIAADPEEAARHDHFHNITPESEWKACLEHAEKIGMGTRSYELITVK